MKKLFSMFLVFSLVMVFAFSFASAAELGEIAAGEMPTWAAGIESNVAAKIVDEYDAQADAGFDFGTPWQAVKTWDNYVAFQPFNGGDNEGNLWNWGMVGEEKVGAGFIMYSEGADRAYSLINEMSEAWGALGHWGAVGYPVSNQFMKDGKIYQNFSLGYLEITPGDSSTAVLNSGSMAEPTPEPTATEAPSATDVPTATTAPDDTEAPGDAGSIGFILMGSLAALAGTAVFKGKKR